MMTETVIVDVLTSVLVAAVVELVVGRGRVDRAGSCATVCATQVVEDTCGRSCHDAL